MGYEKHIIGTGRDKIINKWHFVENKTQIMKHISERQ
jgi:hypothetical protein